MVDNSNNKITNKNKKINTTGLIVFIIILSLLAWLFYITSVDSSPVDNSSFVDNSQVEEVEDILDTNKPSYEDSKNKASELTRKVRKDLLKVSLDYSNRINGFSLTEIRENLSLVRNDIDLLIDDFNSPVHIAIKDGYDRCKTELLFHSYLVEDALEYNKEYINTQDIMYLDKTRMILEIIDDRMLENTISCKIINVGYEIQQKL